MTLEGNSEPLRQVPDRHVARVLDGLRETAGRNAIFLRAEQAVCYQTVTALYIPRNISTLGHDSARRLAVVLGCI